MAVGGQLVWLSEVDKAACTVLAAHYPAVPNLGDLKLIDWATVQSVDVITAGYPCQPFSHAGKREGVNDDRHLWPYIREAVSVLRPGLVVLENVRGHLSLGLKEVLADLTDIGYDAQWRTVRASDAGAPHQRAKGLHYSPHPARRGVGERGRDGLILNPKGQQDLQHKIAHLLPTPTVVDMGNNKTPPEWEAWLQAMKTRHGNGNGHGKSLTQELIGVDTSQPSGDGKQ